jgi:O-antigen/teichoic acid export membrane protein
MSRPMHSADRDIEGAPSPAYGRLAVSGSVWTTLQTFGNKIAAVAAIYVLSRLLAPGDFGLANFAASIGAFAFMFPPYVMGDVLISAPARFRDRSGAALIVVAYSGVALAALVSLLAWPIELITGKAGLCVLLLVVAVRPLGDAFMIVPMARLRLDLAFRRIATIDGLVVLAATLSSIVLAIIGFGPVAIILPPIATLVAKGVFYWISVRDEVPLHAVTREVRPLRREFLIAGVGQYLNNIVAIVEVLVLGYFATDAELGYFAFAFQLAIQVNAVIAGQLGSVLQPIFGRLHDDPSRQVAAFMRATRFLAAFAVPLSMIQAAVALPLFVAVFGEKWMPAVPAFCALSLAQGVMFAGAPAVAMLKAQGSFRAYLWLQAGQLAASLALFVSSLLWGIDLFVSLGEAVGLPMPQGAGPPFAIAMASALVWSLFLPFAVWMGCRRGNVRLQESIGLFLRPIVVSLPCTVAVWASYRVLADLPAFGATGAAWTVMLAVAPFALAIAVGGCCFAHSSTRNDLRSFFVGFRARISRQSST